MSDTLASLRFASRAAKIPITQDVNSAPDPFLQARELKREVETLKRELSIQSLLSGGRSTIGIEPLNANQIQEAKRQVDEFLQGGTYPDIVSNRQLQGCIPGLPSIGCEKRSDNLGRQSDTRW